MTSNNTKQDTTGTHRSRESISEEKQELAESDTGSHTQGDTLPDSKNELHDLEAGVVHGDVDQPDAASGKDGPPHSAFSEAERRMILILCSFSGLISNLSATIYLPSLNTLSHDLHVSSTLINLTITAYMILQGIAPSFLGGFSDKYGRRPIYLICFVVYIAACIGLALQSSYPALLVLRCLQSTGSSSFIALASGIVADLSTRAERGKWLAWAMISMLIGPIFGPVIGGLLNKYLGWRSIFWFLTILAGVVGLLVLFFLPETCRAVVGNGSLPTGKWHTSVMDLLRRKKHTRDEPAPETKSVPRHVNPWDSVLILADKEGGCILAFGSLLFAGYFMVLNTLSEELNVKYGYNSLEQGLCYLPMGAGAVMSRFTATNLVDRNYRRISAKMGITIRKNRQEARPNDFPIERARLQVGIPMIYLAAAFITMYGWVMHFNTSIAGPLVCLFFLGLTSSGAFTILGTLVVDTNLDRPAMAVATVNLARCLVGAGFTAFALPLIHAIGTGWTSTLVAAIWVVASPLLWLIMSRGQGWREAKRLKAEARATEQG